MGDRSMSTIASRNAVAAALDGANACVSRNRARTQRSGSPRAAGAATEARAEHLRATVVQSCTQTADAVFAALRGEG